MNKKFNYILILLTIFHTLAFPTDNGNNSYLGASLFVTTVVATIGARYVKNNQLKINNKLLNEEIKNKITTHNTNNMTNLIESTKNSLSRSNSNSSLSSTNPSIDSNKITITTPGNFQKKILDIRLLGIKIYIQYKYT